MKNKVITLLTVLICLPTLGIKKEDPDTNKTNSAKAIIQFERKKRKQEKSVPLTTTVTTSTAIAPIFAVYWWTPKEN